MRKGGGSKKLDSLISKQSHQSPFDHLINSDKL